MQCCLELKYISGTAGFMRAQTKENKTRVFLYFLFMAAILNFRMTINCNFESIIFPFSYRKIRFQGFWGLECNIIVLKI